MNDRTARYLRAKEIVATADGLPPEDRAAFVARECSGDAALLAEVAWMRKALASETTLPTIRWEPEEPLELDGEQLSGPSERDYRVVRRIGHGGMGVVYLAERCQDGFVQRVALKLLRRAVGDSRPMLERFQRERALLARLEHPGIARLVDGGLLADGQPFLAIEYVEGEHIDRWCREHSPDLRQRLELFLQVCAAVEYAHRHLVIHRDLKPGNILVTPDGRTKLLDFGIARLLDTGDGTPVEATEFGQHALTVAYASPEQITQKPLSVATDIYSLGVVLYQLVCGQQPFGHHGSSFDASRAIVAGEVIPPSRQAKGSGGLARIPADIDAIVLKSMRRETDARYVSVSALAADVVRFLQRRPIDARRSHVGYRARRFVSRNRWPLAAGGVIALTLTAGITVSLAALSSARGQQHLAEQRQQQLERITAFQQDMLESVDIDAMGHAMWQAQRDAIVAAASGNGPDPGAVQRLDDALARVPATDIAREALDRFVVMHALARVEDDFADTPQLAADMRHSMARVLLGIGQYGSAITELERVLEKRTRVLPPGDPRIVSVLVDLGAARLQAGDIVGANRSYTMAAEGLPGLDADDALRLAVEAGAARTLAARGELQAALERQSGLIRRWSTVLDPHDAALLELRRDEVQTLSRLGRREEARERMAALLPHYEASVGAGDRKTLTARLTFAELTNTLNEYEESQRQAHAVVLERERRLGRDHPDTLMALALEGANRVRLAQAEPAFSQTERFMRELLARQVRVLGADHPQTLASQSDLVRLLGKQADPDKTRQALQLHTEVWRARQRLLGPDHLDTIFSLGGLANLQRKLGRNEEAIATAQETLRRFERTVPDHRLVSATWELIGAAQYSAGRLRLARDAYARSLAQRDAMNGPLDAHTIESASGLYATLFALGDEAGMARVRSRHLDPVLQLDVATLNASMLGIRETARRALQGQNDD
ncbi:serine/threonine-protein kinase [Luteimonas deserti]|uniref:Serine/threonine protein kinase n=1 Tax=Luteimonas deserti TaxID=2752306 RepID=A0A7Z0QUP1_9GAMM|nr:serine/threonine-protein kinase [Luteimonas deserti]NYZ64291.1 serine/threonine protein kinase [Luteimonas deserti]